MSPYSCVILMLVISSCILTSYADAETCETKPSLCGPNSRCEKMNGSYMCMCAPGYHDLFGACFEDSVARRQCQITGDLHFKTFAGAWFTYNTQCKVLMSQQAQGWFSVYSHFAPRPEWQRTDDDVTYLHHTEIVIFDLNIMLMGDKAAVPGFPAPTPLPFSHIYKGVRFYINQSNGTTYFLTNKGLTVEYHYARDTQNILITDNYAGQLRGMCGDFYTPEPGSYFQGVMRDGEITDNAADFGNSWKKDSSCPDVQNMKPCVKAGSLVETEASEICGVIQSTEWSSCNHLVNPAPYIANCVFDFCGCNQTNTSVAGAGRCVCGSIHNYEDDCRKAGGVPPIWRSYHFCEVALEVRCGDAPPAEGASITYTSNNRVQGSNAFYQCNKTAGYTGTGKTGVIRCTKDGTWTQLGDWEGCKRGLAI